MSKSIGVISLGCDKNRVDTENMLSYLTKEGYKIVTEPQNAQVLIVNTCAFISSAREESINTILEMAEYKKTGQCSKLIVTGCITKRHLPELYEALPEVDAFLGTGDYNRLPEIIRGLFQKEDRVCCDDQSDIATVERVISTPAHYAYLKIADGCNNRCTYCTIPSIRGAYRSRSIESLVDESKRLIDSGVKEIILVAQDVTRYGSDRGENKLLELAERLTSLNGLKMLRFMYCYPEMVTKELITAISQSEKIAKYIDIPMQHADDRILRLMNRRSTNASLSNLVSMIREIDGQIAIRSTFMVGFPGETEECFQTLVDFIMSNKLDHTGFFAYSKEEGTPSYKLTGHLTKAVKRKRLEIIGSLAKKIMSDNNKKYLGKVLEVCYEGIDFERDMFYGRIAQQAPEIDSQVYFTGAFADVGNYYKVKITGTLEYDLIGEMV